MVNERKFITGIQTIDRKKNTVIISILLYKLSEADIHTHTHTRMRMDVI